MSGQGGGDRDGEVAVRGGQGGVFGAGLDQSGTHPLLGSQAHPSAGHVQSPAGSCAQERTEHSQRQ